MDHNTTTQRHATRHYGVSANGICEEIIMNALKDPQPGITSIAGYSATGNGAAMPPTGYTVQNLEGGN